MGASKSIHSWRSVAMGSRRCGFGPRTQIDFVIVRVQRDRLGRGDRTVKNAARLDGGTGSKLLLEVSSTTIGVNELAMGLLVATLQPDQGCHLLAVPVEGFIEARFEV